MKQYTSAQSTATVTPAIEFNGFTLSVGGTSYVIDNDPAESGVDYTVTITPSGSSKSKTFKVRSDIDGNSNLTTSYTRNNKGI